MRSPTIEQVDKMTKKEIDEQINICISKINMALVHLEKFDICVSGITINHSNVMNYEDAKQSANMQGFMPTVELTFTTDKWFMND